MSFLFDQEGHRKYLTGSERRAFLSVAHRMPIEVSTFLLTLAFTGARISEVLSLTPAQINVGAGIIVIECLKKRRPGMFRAVPIPEQLLAELDRVHHLSASAPPLERAALRLWPWCRTTAWHYVKACMADAGIIGPQASPKGLRHAFAVNALDVSVPLPLIQKWLGHSRLTTTAIYTNAVGAEERAIAARYWNAF